MLAGSLRSSFAPAFLLLPEPRREALVALHRFCRAADEAVDGASARDASSLDLWRHEVDALYGFGAPRTPEGAALAPYVPRYGMERRDFETLLEGLASDARGDVIGTEEDLARYCLGVAAAPGFLSLAIFGCPEARDYAHRLGLALQRTNILRDAREDIGIGRVYFPREDLGAAGVTLEDLAIAAASSEPEPEAIRRFVDHQRESASAWFGEAETAYRAQSRDARRRLGAARGMHYLYRALLDRLERESPLPRRRVRPSRARVLTAVLRAWRDTALAG
jgi:phytoene synthase